MRNRMFALSVFVLLLAVSAVAGPSDRLMAEIPFDFYIGEKSMPAGHYIVNSNITADGSVQLISSENSRHHVAVMTHLGDRRMYTRDESKLVFNRYGNTYYLSQIWYSGGSSLSRELRVSKSEREMAMVNTAETIQLALAVTPQY